MAVTDFPNVQPSAIANLQHHLDHCPLCVDERRCRTGEALERAYAALPAAVRNRRYGRRSDVLDDAGPAFIGRRDAAPELPGESA